MASLPCAQSDLHDFPSLMMAARAPSPKDRPVRGDLYHCGKCEKKLLRPLLLTCFHSHCTECVEDLMKGARGRIIKCPTCEKSATVQGENIFIKTSMAVLWSGKTTHKCDICLALDKRTDATHVCA